MPTISSNTVGRLGLYRRLLKDIGPSGTRHVFSHELAQLAGCTAAQVRRDVMALGFTGSPARGYAVDELVAKIGELLDGHTPKRTALVGVGNLGRALLAYFVGRNPQFSLVAAFDTDGSKVNRVIHGCRCYPMELLEAVVAREDISLAMIAVPAEQAQDVASRLCRSGVRGVLNFAPVRVWAPEGVHVEHLDMTMALERVAYFATRGGGRARKGGSL